MLLCGVGAAASAAVILLLLYFFIAKERRRTAIERGLGMTKRQCYISLVSGILVLALIGTVLGSGLGILLIGQADLESSNTDDTGMYSVYSTRYSDWTNKWNQVTQIPETEVTQLPLLSLSCAIPLVLLVFIFVLSVIMVKWNLRIEPIQLLGGSGTR